MRSLSAVLFTLSTVVGPVHADGEVGVSFFKPRDQSQALDRTEVDLRVQLPPGAAVENLELLVDGRRLALLVRPPWTAVWDAGDGSRDHTLEAILRLADGRAVRDTVTTRALHIDQVERVDLVSLYLIVRDRSGRYVRDLKQEDFRLLEDGAAQAIDRFSNTHQPLRVGLALDTSQSMTRDEKLAQAQAAALAFLEVLEPGDEGLVVNFDDSVQVAQELTGDHEQLARAVRGTRAKGGTALYDAIWRTTKKLSGFDGRRVLVLLSDGRDEAYDGLGPGSTHTLDEAIEQALRNEVMVFCIGLGTHLDREYAMRWGKLGGLPNVDVRQSLESILQRVAEATGGRAVISPSAGKLRRAFDELAEDLRHQYAVAYSSNSPRRDGKWRRVEVTVPGRNVNVVTRKGYYAAGG